MVSRISYSNKEVAFLSEDQFDNPELSQHAAFEYNNNFCLQINHLSNTHPDFMKLLHNSQTISGPDPF